MGRSTRRLGTKGERAAEGMLRQKRFRILERNYTCRFGEVDLVADDSGTIVFVEVKTRMTDRYGPPEISVTPRKQRRYTRAAAFYLKQKKLLNVPIRFDVVSVLMSEDGRILQRDLIRNAFQDRGTQ
ncbi:MAG: YraN family protein [Planctomycetota bacterium]|nr:YraN family protein [Planctomycetota bacterium]